MTGGGKNVSPLEKSPHAGEKIVKIVVTAGPTREKIDRIRYLSNRSSGKMGFALAEAAQKCGAEVVLISGPVALTPPENIRHIQVESAQEMLEAVRREVAGADLLVMAAAVADYRPVKVFEGKMKKSDGELFLELERTPDILLEIGKHKRPGQVFVGFAAETSELLSRAEEKLRRKHLDWIVANDIAPADRGFESDDNAAVLLGKNGERCTLPLMRKSELADRLLEFIWPRK